MPEHDPKLETVPLAAVPRRVAAQRRPRKIRYTDAEWGRVECNARLVGRAPARYVRETSLGVVPRAPRPRADAALVREIGRVGATLAALSASMKQGGAPAASDALAAALAELLAVVRRIG